MAKKTNLNAIKKDVKAFKELVDRSGFDDLKVYLYGSWAKGKATDDSDIDVCVVSDKFKGNMFDNMVMLNKMAMKINVLIDVVPMTSSDLKDKYSSLVIEVLKYGVEI